MPARGRTESAYEMANGLPTLLLDIASLSIKSDKPLSARLMPIPNKTMGQLTNFKFEYFVNSKVMKI
ncbi:unnamed protein product [marine sediment metagenome]|uniref:Uncharacterized protein n=1 Tax=marine sediment metagenome TaxID=412755 RepID=X1MHC7_9ZZZZ